jgi:hypothetical protein
MAQADAGLQTVREPDTLAAGSKIRRDFTTT